MQLWPFAVYILAVLLLVAVMIGLSALLGERRMSRQTPRPFESGMPTTGSARARYSVKFYVVAMLFVIFDLEAVFLFAWAVTARSLGWPGFFGALAFIGILVAGLIYEWKQGALDWGSAGRAAGRETRPEDAAARRGAA